MSVDTRALSTVHRIERVLLAAFALWAGAWALAMVLVPKLVIARGLGVSATGAMAIAGELGAGPRLALALVALVAARMAKPPRALVGAIAIGLVLGVAGVGFNRVLGIVVGNDVKPFTVWLVIDGIFGVSLGILQIVRFQLRQR